MSNLPAHFDKNKANPFAKKKEGEKPEDEMDEMSEDEKPESEDSEDETDEKPEDEQSEDETDKKPAAKNSKDNLTKGDPCWDGYKKVPGKADYADDSCAKDGGAAKPKTSDKKPSKKPKGEDMDEDETPDADLQKHEDEDAAEKSAVGMIEATDLFSMLRAVAEEGFQKGVAFAEATAATNFSELLEPLVKSALVKAIQEDDATKTAFRFIVGGRIGKEFAQYGEKMNDAVAKTEAAMEMVQKGIIELDTLTKGAILTRDDVARTTPAKKAGQVTSEDVLLKGAYPDPSEEPELEQDLLVKGATLTARGIELQRKNRTRQILGLSDAIAERDAKSFTVSTVALLEKSIAELS